MSNKLTFSTIDDISEYIIKRFELNEVSISFIKLQRMLYYIQAWHLVYFDHPLFMEEPEAWANGPAYRGVKKYNDDSDKINSKTEESYQDLSNRLKFNKNQNEFLDSIFEYYGKMTAQNLSIQPHCENRGPWSEARQGLGPVDFKEGTISHEEIKKYYSNKKK